MGFRILSTGVPGGVGGVTFNQTDCLVNDNDDNAPLKEAPRTCATARMLGRAQLRRVVGGRGRMIKGVTNNFAGKTSTNRIFSPKLKLTFAQRGDLKSLSLTCYFWERENIPSGWLKELTVGQRWSCVVA